MQFGTRMDIQNFTSLFAFKLYVTTHQRATLLTSQKGTHPMKRVFAFITALAICVIPAAAIETLPSEFTFTDGAGAWYTNIILNQDGTFTGEYRDYSVSDTGEGLASNFGGKFTELQKIDEYTYSMNLDSLSLIYLPGRPMNEEEMNNLSGSYVGVALYEGIMPSGMYCIYNVDEKAGFSGME